jgi:hypothetical protein
MALRSTAATIAPLWVESPTDGRGPAGTGQGVAQGGATPLGSCSSV